MRQDVYGRIQSAIQSISMSTFAQCIQARTGLCITLDGQRSPYVSHRTIEFTTTGHRDEWSVLTNKSERILAVFSRQCASDYRMRAPEDAAVAALKRQLDPQDTCDIHFADVPASDVYDHVPAELRLRADHSDIITVAVPMRRVVRYEYSLEACKHAPVFAEPKPPEPTPEPRYSLAAIRAAGPCAERYRVFMNAIRASLPADVAKFLAPDSAIAYGHMEATDTILAPSVLQRFAWTRAELAALTCQSDADWVKEHVTPEKGEQTV